MKKRVISLALAVLLLVGVLTLPASAASRADVYNYFKNRLECKSLGQQDYYKTQGLAFLMLVEALIHHEFEEASRAVQGFSVQDCLLQARMVKADKRHGVWCVANCIPRQQKLFKKLNTPLTLSVNGLGA